jgi:hypothetical protein
VAILGVAGGIAAVTLLKFVQPMLGFLPPLLMAALPRDRLWIEGNRVRLSWLFLSDGFPLDSIKEMATSYSSDRRNVIVTMRRADGNVVLRLRAEEFERLANELSARVRQVDGKSLFLSSVVAYFILTAVTGLLIASVMWAIWS